MNELKCASCGSPDLEFFPGNYGRCRSCGTTFAETAPGGAAAPMPYQPSYYVPPPPPPPPMGYTQPKRATGAIVIVSIMAVLFMFFAGAIVFANFGFNASRRATSGPPATVTSSSGSSSTPVNAEQPVTVDVPKDPVTKAEFRDIGNADFSDGRMWIGRYFNTGESVIGSGSVTLSLFDETGKRLVEQPGYLPVEWLEPGQFTLVNIWVSKVPVYAKFEFKVQCTAAADYVSKPLPVAIVEQSSRKSGTYSEDFVGTVQNTNKVAVEFVRIVVYGYDDKGAPCSVAYGYATDRVLEPNAKSGFNVSMGGITVGKPARYTALGRISSSASLILGVSSARK
jgi:hypothetical protein